MPAISKVPIHYESEVCRSTRGARSRWRRSVAEAFDQSGQLSVTAGCKLVVEALVRMLRSDGIWELGALLQETTFQILARVPSEHRGYLAMCDSGLDVMYGYAADGLSGHIPRDTVAGMLLTAMQVNFHTTMFELEGKRIYDVSPALGAQLAATSLRGVMAEDLRLPYRSVYLVVPPEAGLKVWNSETGWHVCQGIYVIEDSVVETRKPDGSGDQCGRGWRFLVVGESLPGKIGDDALEFFQIPLPDGVDIDGCLEPEYQGMLGLLKRQKITGAGPEMFSAEWREAWLGVFRWAMNVVLYVTHVEPGERWEVNDAARALWARVQKLPKGKKRERLLERWKAEPKQERILLGRSVVNRHCAAGEGSGAGARGPLAVRARVAGHWKRIVHGAGRTERRWQWIEPYWRGEGIELVSRHEVK